MPGPPCTWRKQPKPTPPTRTPRSNDQTRRLADARQVRHLPGRPKRDPADSRWLAACFERGTVTACFGATPEFRIIRLHTRRYDRSRGNLDRSPGYLLAGYISRAR
jgi:hypothetical protein